VSVLGWGGTVAAFCFVSVEQCVFISDVVFCFSGFCHIYVYIKGLWRGMAVGKGCGVHSCVCLCVCVQILGLGILQFGPYMSCAHVCVCVCEKILGLGILQFRVYMSCAHLPPRAHPHSPLYTHSRTHTHAAPALSVCVCCCCRRRTRTLLSTSQRSRAIRT
jgi:hypothetical protein